MAALLLRRHAGSGRRNPRLGSATPSAGNPASPRNESNPEAAKDGAVGRGFGPDDRPPNPAPRVRPANRRPRPPETRLRQPAAGALGDLARSRRRGTSRAPRRRRCGEHRVRRSRIRSRRSTAESCAPDPGDEPASPSIRQPLAGSPPPRPRGHRGGGGAPARNEPGAEAATMRGTPGSSVADSVPTTVRRVVRAGSGRRTGIPARPRRSSGSPPPAPSGTSRGVAGAERAGRRCGGTPGPSVADSVAALDRRILRTGSGRRTGVSVHPTASRRQPAAAPPGTWGGGGTGTERAGRRCGEHRVRRSRIPSRRSSAEWCAPGPAGEPVSPPARDAPPTARRRAPGDIEGGRRHGTSRALMRGTPGFVGRGCPGGTPPPKATRRPFRRSASGLRAADPPQFASAAAPTRRGG